MLCGQIYFCSNSPQHSMLSFHGTTYYSLVLSPCILEFLYKHFFSLLYVHLYKWLLESIKFSPFSLFLSFFFTEFELGFGGFLSLCSLRLKKEKMMRFLCNNDNNYSYVIVLASLMLFLSVFNVNYAKECTNTPTPLSSKTLRYEVLTSKNETWKKEMMSHNHNHDYHLTHTDDSTWSSLFPRKMLKEDDDELSWNFMYKKIKYSELKGSFLSEISLHNVRLDPQSLHGRAQQTNLEYLLILDVDRLVWSFRKTAGLATPGIPYGGWEAPNVELRGHFVGHYLSATAQMWASTHNETLREKMTTLVSALKECQDAMGVGYLSAFPSELFDRFEAVQPVWAPYYTIHKIMAGLLDQYNLAGSDQALKMVTQMADYFYKRVQNVIMTYTLERHWLSLNEETGGMNDVLYRLYTVTNDQKHLLLAHLFDKPCFLGLLALKADDISGFHANTHIPIVIGAQMRYEVTGDELYKEIGTFFLDVVNSTHSFATGGTSVSEFWVDPKRLGDRLHTENEESCTTYNMLKVSRNLFRWSKEMIYADYYERALTNGVLGIQRGTQPGVMIYMLPLGHGVSKGRSYHKWGTLFDSFWCCYGTGIESFSKLGDSIYFEETGSTPGLYVIQYISSSINWTSAQLSLTQVVDDAVSWDQSLKVKITVATQHSGTATLNLRIPSWTSSSGIKASVNGDPLTLPTPGNFLSVSRNWGNGDTVLLQFPLGLRTEFIQDDRPQFASLQAILYGPYLLAGLSPGDYDIQTGALKSTSDWITSVPADYNSYLVSLMQQYGDAKFFLSNHDKLITMQGSPQAGNDSSVHSTFRLILKDPSPSKKTRISGPETFINKAIYLEPFDLPGMVLAHQGGGNVLTIAKAGDDMSLAEFLVVKGLNGVSGTVSLKTKDGCFVYGGLNSKSDQGVKLSCESQVSDPAKKEAASFTWNEGLKKYHPISFVAKGLRRSYVLEPLFGLRDESYNVYFNITN
ncbi:uncharacterized protein LOC141619437 [Silene latifolia]|uniref:uncharacterized protein LOC141619437 n=1 Tax=Silene latifolia TaxID=37657 RepID=UPI003D779E43